MKKLIATLLTITCAMALFSIFAFAETARSSGDFTYEVKGNGTAEITGYSGEQADIILPNMIDGYTITSIGDLAFYSEDSQWPISVTIPDSVVSIGEKVFWNRNVRSINLPDGLESIGYGAFVGCDECQFRVSANHPYFAVVGGSLYNKAQKELLWPAEGATILDGIVSIGDYAFYGRQYVNFDEIIVIPSSVQSIGNYAFSEMVLLEDLQIPASVTSIGIGAFENSDGTIIIASSQLRSIPDYAFKNTASEYSRVYFSSSTLLKYIGAGAFRGNSLTNVYLPANLEFIDPAAFDEDVTFTVEQGSYAERWADENARVYSINGEQSDLDWLDQ